MGKGGGSFSMVCTVNCVGVSKNLWGVLNVPSVFGVSRKYDEFRLYNQ